MQLASFIVHAVPRDPGLTLHSLEVLRKWQLPAAGGETPVPIGPRQAEDGAACARRDPPGRENSPRGATAPGTLGTDIADGEKRSAVLHPDSAPLDSREADIKELRLRS
ncbi:unnamed protein product [Lampetra fluviatilis]